MSAAGRLASRIDATGLRRWSRGWSSGRCYSAFAEFVDPHPAFLNGFGETVVTLSTGNVVITAPGDSTGGPYAGAVYLFNGATGALISTMTGTQLYDHLGSDGVTALANGNFVVRSSQWDNGTIVDAGAVTWGNGVTGFSGAVSAANSPRRQYDQ